jgi:hypothetical protein
MSKSRRCPDEVFQGLGNFEWACMRTTRRSITEKQPKFSNPRNFGTKFHAQGIINQFGGQMVLQSTLQYGYEHFLEQVNLAEQFRYFYWLKQSKLLGK